MASAEWLKWRGVPFWGRVDRTGPIPDFRPDLGPCWLWLASCTTDGYGNIRQGGVTRRAHRLAYEEVVGPIPEGLELDHLCRVRHCVNPDHLEAVTHAENVRRADQITGMRAAATHCPEGHEYTPENTYVRPSRISRACRRCRYESNKRRYWERRAERA